MKKNLIPILVAGLSLLWVGLSSCTGDFSGKGFPKADQGVLDLRSWDLALQGPVPLNGQWDFYWKQLLGPEDFLKGISSSHKATLQVPGIWKGRLLDGREITGQGYGTYHLQVLLKPAREMMAFKFMSLGTAFSLYVNGKKVTGAGRVGTTRETMTPEWNPHVVRFMPESDHLDLILQISNFHHRKGGATESIWLGRESDIGSLRERNVAIQLFLCGSILIMGLYHLGIFILRKKDRTFLYFGLFSLLIALYTLLAGERYFLNLFPAAGWELRVKLTNFSSFLSLPIFLLFVNALFPEDSKKKVTGFLIGSVGLLALVVLVTPAIIYSQVIPVFHLLALAGGIYTLTVFFQAIGRKREGAALLSLGVLILVASVVNDILYDNALINTGQTIYLGLFLFIFIQSFILSLRYSRAFTIVEKQSLVLSETNKALEGEIKERQKMEQALAESEKKYHQLMEEAPVGLWNVDLQGRILDVNRRFEEIFGYSREEVLGKNGLELDQVSSETRAIITERMRERLAGRPQLPIEIKLVRKNGERKWIELIARVLEEQGRPSGFQIAASDINDRKLAQKELQKANDQLEKRVGERTAALDRTNKNLREEIAERERTERQLKRAKEIAEAANRSKSDFLANMSHELRTPLNHIIGFGELLSDKHFGELNPVQEEYLNDILQSGRHLLSLINDILDLSKVEAGKMKLEVSQIYLKPLLENSLVMVKEKAHKNRIKLHSEFGDLPEFIQADERKLKQILYNLLSNAVKFAPNGCSVLLSATHVQPGVRGLGPANDHKSGGITRDTQPKADFIEINVTDTGIGIEKNYLERIFLPFEQADNSIRRKYQGTGLGLALTKKMVELHGGRIWAESDGEGQGACFHFTLPIDPVKWKNTF